MHEPIGVAFDSPLASVRDHAERLAGELGLPFAAPDAHGYALLLTVTDQRLELREAGQQTGPVYVDFITGPTAARRKRGGGPVIPSCVPSERRGRPGRSGM